MVSLKNMWTWSVWLILYEGSRYWLVLVEQVIPELASGKNIMIAAHGNSLRAIIMYLDKLTSQEVYLNEITAQFFSLCGDLQDNFWYKVGCFA